MTHHAPASAPETSSRFRLRLFPSTAYAFELPISVDDAVARLQAATTRGKLLRWSKPATTFEGSVTSRSFEITRIISHRNSFNPLVTGRIVPTSLGCRVEGTLRLPAFVRGFMGIWLTLVLFSGCNMLLSPDLNRSRGGILIPVGMLLFGIGLTHGAFRADSGGSLRALEAVLRAPGDDVHER